MMDSAVAQTPTVSRVVNGLSSTPNLSPGVLASVLGNNFGNDKATLAVTVGGRPAHLALATNTQLAIQVPVELQPGPATLTVTRSGAAAAPLSINLDAFSPGLATNAGNALLLGGTLMPITQIRTGDTVTAYATGLGPTTPVLSTGAALPNNVMPLCNAVPQVSVGGVAAAVLFCGPSAVSPGTYQITFTVPGGILAGIQPLVLSVGGFNSPPVNVTVAARPPTISSVAAGVGGAKQAPIAPGSLVTVSGVSFGTKDAVTGFPATTLQGVSVTMNGIQAPLVDILASALTAQIHVIAPMELPTQGTIPVIVTTADGSSAPFDVNLAAASPSIFRTNFKNYGAISLVNSSLPAADAAQPWGVTINCGLSGMMSASNCGRPFKPGDVVQLYATGLGVASPGGDPNAVALGTGQLAPADGSVTYETTIRPTVTIGGVPAQVAWSGIVPGLAGAYQVNINIPAAVAPGDDVMLTLTAGGLSDSVSIAIAGQ